MKILLLLYGHVTNILINCILCSVRAVDAQGPQSAEPERVTLRRRINKKRKMALCIRFRKPALTVGY